MVLLFYSSICEATLGARNIKPYSVLPILLFSLFFFSPIGLYAEKKESLRWSIDFNNISISEALNKLSQTTGFKIHITKPLDIKIKKSYKDKTIEQILKDVLRNINHTLVWSYNQKDVDSIGIVIFEQGKSTASKDQPPQGKANTKVQAPPRGFSYPQQPRPVLRQPIPKKPDHESAAEQGDKETEEDKGGTEEKESESTDSGAELTEKQKKTGGSPEKENE